MKNELIKKDGIVLKKEDIAIMRAKKFFEKMKKMSWYDTTRKSIRDWFVAIEEKIDKGELNSFIKLENLE